MVRVGACGAPATVVATLRAAESPFGLAITRGGTPTIWVASFGSDSLLGIRPPGGLFLDGN
jgi:hypothetical protein